MGLLKKSNKTKKNNNTDDIEIVDLDTGEDKIVNTLEQRNEFKIALIIGISVIIFALLLPTITSIFTKDSIFSYTDKVNEIVNDKTINGMLELNKEEGSITAKRVKFYSPRKSTNNQISVTYLPETVFNDVDSLNLYIEIYNSNKELITRVKFTNITKLERKVQGSYKINLNETIYKEAKYFKITIIKDKYFDKINDTLLCKYTLNDSNLKVDYERLYNFTKNGLLSYKVAKSFTLIDTNNPDLVTKEKYTKLFNTEKDNLSKTNLQDITLTENTLEYTITLNEFKIGKSTYQKLYEQGSVKRQIELSEENMNWTCE